MWAEALEPTFRLSVLERVPAYREQIAKVRTALHNEPVVGLCHSDAEHFMAGWLAALEAGCEVFLGNPDWRKAAWAEVSRSVRVDVALGQWQGAAGESLKRATLRSGLIYIPTGGTGGRVRFVAHSTETLKNASLAQAQDMGKSRINALSVLPLFHVSGLMPWARAAFTGGVLRLADWQLLKKGDFPPAQSHSEQLSLVPAQLVQLLGNTQGTNWLRQFEYVLTGGAACPASLVVQGREQGVAVTPCYGMTETAAFFAWQPPELPVETNELAARLLPHVSVSCVKETDEILVATSSLALGYWAGGGGLVPLETPFPTGDTGEIVDGLLRVTGRMDRLINTGGEKIHPERVEAVLRSHPSVSDVHVYGQSDERWGEKVVAAIVLKDTVSRIRDTIAEELKSLARHELEVPAVPRNWLFLESLPRFSNGKLNQEAFLELAAGA